MISLFQGGEIVIDITYYGIKGVLSKNPTIYLSEMHCKDNKLHHKKYLQLFP